MSRLMTGQALTEGSSREPIEIEQEGLAAVRITWLFKPLEVANMPALNWWGVMLHKDYFETQFANENAEFWRRLPPVDFAGAAVLDLGCGHGALCVDIARRGAARVVGLDIDEDRIAFAREHIDKNFPDTAGAISFTAADISKLEGQFDVVVSKDSFEHIDNLEGVMRDIRRVLKPGGQLLAGFSPLYYSPFGDHGRYVGVRAPWLTAILPERALVALASRRHRRPIRSAADLGLNKLTPAGFRRMIATQGWRVLGVNYNAGDKPLLKLMRWLRVVPVLERYFTTSIYARLQAP